MVNSWFVDETVLACIWFCARKWLSNVKWILIGVWFSAAILHGWCLIGWFDPLEYRWQPVFQGNTSLILMRFRFWVEMLNSWCWMYPLFLPKQITILGGQNQQQCHPQHHHRLTPLITIHDQDRLILMISDRFLASWCGKNQETVGWIMVIVVDDRRS